MEEALKALNEAVEEQKKVSKRSSPVRRKLIVRYHENSYDVDKSVESNKQMKANKFVVRNLMFLFYC